MAGRGRTQGVVNLENVCLAYDGGDKADIVAIDEISLEIRGGERLLLLGPSGCGKSTILRAIGGFMSPRSGSITFEGNAVKKPGPDRLFVFQEFDQLLPWKTVHGNITFALNVTRSHGRADVEEQVHAAISTVGLEGFADAYPHQLSGGMKQRVAIARALALRPPVLLMDEPFAALDAQTRQQMQEELLALHAQMSNTLIFVTHSVSEAIILADRIVVLSRGPGSRVVDIIETGGRGADLEGTPEYTELTERIRAGLHRDAKGESV